jgi:hypothetical protein
VITINGFLHRARLRDLIRRWIFNELHAGDVDELLRLVHFNNVYVSRYLEQLAGTLFTRLCDGALHVEKVNTKGALRDHICRCRPAGCERCTELAAGYAHHPGRFFRETPFHGSLYFHDSAGATGYAGSSRIKRIRRLAEKSARKLVDWLHEPATTPTGSAPVDPLQQEWQLLQRLQAARTAPDPPRLAINDIAGIKVILDRRGPEHLVTLLQETGCRLVEREDHHGSYRATNLVAEYRPDRTAILGEPLHDRMLRVFAAHGYTQQQANAAFLDFVRSGEEYVSVEIIATGYADMLESEIGRCMHEERIIRQRHNPRYYGQLAQNTEFLMEFLFTFPALPHRRLDRLPLRIGDRYLPDYFDEVWRRLFNNPSVELNEL